MYYSIHVFVISGNIVRGPLYYLTSNITLFQKREPKKDLQNRSCGIHLQRLRVPLAIINWALCLKS